MDTIKIWYVDVDTDFDKEKFVFTELLKEKYNIVLDKNNPEIVFCGDNKDFKSDYLNYKCARIIFLDNGMAPDFNIYDYAITSENIKFSDRHFIYNFDKSRDEKSRAELKDYLCSILEQPKEKMLKRNSAFTMWGKAYEHNFFQWKNYENKWWFKLLYRANR